MTDHIEGADHWPHHVECPFSGSDILLVIWLIVDLASLSPEYLELCSLHVAAASMMPRERHTPQKHVTSEQLAEPKNDLNMARSDTAMNNQIRCRAPKIDRSGVIHCIRPVARAWLGEVVALWPSTDDSMICGELRIRHVKSSGWIQVDGLDMITAVSVIAVCWNQGIE